MLHRVGRLARQPGLVVVVSDFRGELDWQRALRALGARHRLLAVEIRDPREERLEPVGRLSLVDPETGALLEVDTSRRALRERFAAAAAEERAGVATALRRSGRRPRRAVDEGRLAARAGAGAAMSFASPLALLCLAALPLAVLAHVNAQRRRRRYPVRFTALSTLARVAEQEPRWRKHVPFALLALALAALALSLARPQRTVAVAVERASVVLVTDVSRSMSATDVSPTRLEAARRAAQGFLDKVPEELRVGLVAFSDAAVDAADADDRPRACRQRAGDAAADRRHVHRRRACRPRSTT